MPALSLYSNYQSTRALPGSRPVLVRAQTHLALCGPARFGGRVVPDTIADCVGNASANRPDAPPAGRAGRNRPDAPSSVQTSRRRVMCWMRPGACCALGTRWHSYQPRVDKPASLDSQRLDKPASGCFSAPPGRARCVLVTNGGADTLSDPDISARLGPDV